MQADKEGPELAMLLLDAPSVLETMADITREDIVEGGKGDAS